MELLCFCEETGRQQEAVALCTYLAGRDPAEDSPASSSDPLVEATLTRYVHLGHPVCMLLTAALKVCLPIIEAD